MSPSSKPITKDEALKALYQFALQGRYLDAVVSCHEVDDPSKVTTESVSRFSTINFLDIKGDRMISTKYFDYPEVGCRWTMKEKIELITDKSMQTKFYDFQITDECNEDNKREFAFLEEALIGQSLSRTYELDGKLLKLSQSENSCQPYVRQ